MEILYITLKDLLQSIKSWFLIVFALVIPLLLGGFYYAAFGGVSDGEDNFNLPDTSIAIVNLDEGHAYLNEPMGNFFLSTFTSDQMPDNFSARAFNSEAAARQAVMDDEVDVALLVPADFSARLLDTQQPSSFELIAKEGNNPTGVNVVQSIAKSLSSGLETTFTATALTYSAFAQQQLTPPIPEAEDYQAQSSPAVVFNFEDILPAAEQETLRQIIMKPTLGGMMIFFAFFSACSVAMTILEEEKKFTLQRMFTAPFPRGKVFLGKFLAAWVVVFLQVLSLLLISRLLFGLRWGHWTLQILLAILTATIAGGFGVCVLSFLRKEKTAGVIYSGLNTITGMVAIAGTFNNTADIGGISLAMPQGWPLRFIYQMPQGFSPAMLNTIGITLLWSVAFFTLGIWQLNQRYRKEV